MVDDATGRAYDKLEAVFEETTNQLRGDQQARARNLLHYVALRRNDIRPLQEELVSWGLSSLGRCESYVLANVNSVLEILTTLAGVSSVAIANNAAAINYHQGQALSEQSTAALFGPEPPNQTAHIMVTMPASAARDYDLVRDLLASGMSCMRINCAHDDERVWEAMTRNLRRAEQELGRTCRISMDVAGPKLRTGPLPPLPGVVAARPERDRYGRLEQPARILALPAGSTAPAGSVITAGSEWGSVQTAAGAKGEWEMRLKLVEVPDAGHSVLAEGGREVLEAVIGFLTERS